MAKQRKRNIGKIVWILIFSAVAVLGLHYGVKYFMKSLIYEWTDDAFIEGHVVQISPRVAGHVLKVYVDDNQLVKQGQLLVEIDPADYQAKVAASEASLEASKAQVQQVQADIVAAQAEARRTEIDLRRYQEAVNSVSKQQLDNAKAAADSAAAKYIATTKQASVAQARIAEANSALDQDKLQLSYTKIYAPESGKITKKSVEPGSYISVGQPLLAVVPPKMWVVANYKETQLKQIRPGQEVNIKIDAFPYMRLKGRVDSIQSGTGSRFSLLPPENATGNYVKIVQRVPVKIVIDAQSDELQMLSPGMSVVPSIRVKNEP